MPRPVPSARPLHCLRLALVTGLCLGPILACSTGGGDPVLAPARSLSIPEVQGAGHRSPYEGQRVDVRGVIIAVDRQSESFWMQDPRGDGDDATSDAIYVVGNVPEIVTTSITVRVTGEVQEVSRRPGHLTVTQIQADASEIVSRKGLMAQPVVIGRDGRRPPTEVVDDDGLERFDERHDGIDFYESLEHMRVEVREARVVGPTSQYDTFVVVPDRGQGATGLTRNGNLMLRPGDPNPEALMVSSRLATNTPLVDVGDLFGDPIRGILSYDRGAFRLLAYGRMPAHQSSRRQIEVTDLRSGPDAVTIATWNVLNLAVTDDDAKFQRIARGIVGALRSPDIVALQEIQDDSGPNDDGTVSAGRTLEKLIRAIGSAGGPRYDYRQLDPQDRRDGGRPGGNIRNVILFQPQRVEALDADGPSDRINLLSQRSGAQIQPSPARLHAPSFDADDALDWGGTRKPLVAQFQFGDQRLLLINLHLSSKGGDDPIMGARQPPVRPSEGQRIPQARAVRGLVERLLEIDPGAGIVVLGDLNEFPYRTPIAILEGAGLTNMIDSVGYRDRYTFNYRGNSQILDHILISRSLLNRAQPEVDIVHNSVDFSAQRSASDHDPVVLRLTFE
ncbi:MAG: endonuclease/exonuclease/phosphatase family protein [Acidobacteriota bacterium]